MRRLERVCRRCRLVYLEELSPSASQFAGVCPRCGLVDDLAGASRPTSETAA
jgi:hypothetical protein